jgi:hypothetical protein
LSDLLRNNSKHSITVNKHVNDSVFSFFVMMMMRKLGLRSPVSFNRCIRTFLLDDDQLMEALAIPLLVPLLRRILYIMGSDAMTNH